MENERLILFALGEEQPDEPAVAHLESCAECRSGLGALRSVATLGAQTQELRDLPPPPERVWHRIAEEVRPPATVTPIDVRRRWARSWRVPVFAAAAAAVLAISGTLGVTSWRASEDRAPAVTARAALDRLPVAPATATGDARGLDDGDLHLHVTGLPLSAGYYEVWLIDPDSERMISVGTLGPQNDVLLPLPGTVDLNRYRLVDISAEHYDGDTTHSGESLLRGTLTT